MFQVCNIKANIIDSKIEMVNIYGQDTIKAQWRMLLHITTK